MKVPVKICKSCGEVYIIPYIPSLGVQFWLAAFTGIGGIIYWAIRGRGIRCPKCHSRNFDVVLRELDLGV